MANVQISFTLVDVFAHQPLSGNGLSIFSLVEDLSDDLMLSITQEMRQFESIFIKKIDHSPSFAVRIFTMEEELPFAGHPLIGAAAYLHHKIYPVQDEVALSLITESGEVSVCSHHIAGKYWAEMDQGVAKVSPPISKEYSEEILAALNLAQADLMPDLPLQVISTGLPYLIVPLRQNLQHAGIVIKHFEALLTKVGAKFVYVLDVNQREGRTWDNDGRVEDIATGSAAGPAAVYMTLHGHAKLNETIQFKQGQYVGRPSEIFATVSGESQWSVKVRGQVCFVGEGTLTLPR